jgi:hypothetical protein
LLFSKESAKLTKRKRENSQINKIRGKKGSITTHATEAHRKNYMPTH